MKIYHQLGHNYKWALDSHFENNVGDGFIINAYSIEKDKVGKKLSGAYKPEQYLPKTMIDLQFYGSKSSNGGCLNSYEFHPINFNKGQETEVSVVDSAYAAIQYQQKLGLKNILIPNVFIEPDKSKRNIELIGLLNKKIKEHKDAGYTYYLTVPLSGKTIREDEDVEKILQALTDMDICFDGYYVVCEPNVETRKKISVDYKYYSNLNKVLSTLKRSDYKVILGYANVDALVFAALTPLDGVTIGTYENLRNFNIKRFTEDISGGKSDGWYFSEKLLNFVKSKQLDPIRDRGAMHLIENEENIFSDIILKNGYPWNIHRPDVNKNYLLAMSRQFSEIGSQSSRQERIQTLQRLIARAEENYKKLEALGIYLDEESVNYHLPLWKTILETPSIGAVLK